MKELLLLAIVVTISMCKIPDNMEHTQWSQDKLKLPFVIRQMKEIDIPLGDTSFNLWKERESIVLEEGYVFQVNENKKDLNFDFYCEINIDNPKLWKLTKRLLENYYGDAYIVYNLHEDEIQYGAKKPISEIIQKLDKIKIDILNNCSVSIGIVQDEEKLNEVFVDESKYIRYWGTDEAFFRKVMNEFGLVEKEEMYFVDQYPKIVYDWNHVNKKAKTNKELLEYLEKL